MVTGGLVLKNGLILILASVMLIGCGNQEDGIPFRAPQGSNPAPEGDPERIDWFLAKTSSSLMNSASSRAIRRETIGLNLDVRYKDQEKSKADVVVTVSFSESADNCSQAIYRSYDVNTMNFHKPGSKFTIEDFGEASCFRFNDKTKRCDFIYLTITQTPSSIVSSTGLIRGAVPVILENISKNPSQETFIPTIAKNEAFLQVPKPTNDFQYCIKPVQTIQSAADVIFMIDPNSLYDSDEYYNRPYNYTGNGFF
jgi:uncharacterized lipoprotein NlpE involved in copper resistance